MVVQVLRVGRLMVDGNETPLGPKLVADADKVGIDTKSISIESVTSIADLAKHFSRHRVKHDQHWAGSKSCGVEDCANKCSRHDIRRTKPEYESRSDSIA